MPDPELPDFAEAVLAAVDQIPAGRVVSYGDIAEYLGTGGPRQVGRVMALYGGAVSWWRVIRADGRPVAGLEDRTLRRLEAEGVAIRNGRVDLRTARWWFRTGPDEGPDEGLDSPEVDGI